MNRQGEVSSESSDEVQVWEPKGAIRSVATLEAKLANGFLRCHPEKWVPGLAARWTPLLSAIGAELRIGDVRPTLTRIDPQALCFRALIGKESLALVMSNEHARLLADEWIPGSEQVGQQSLVLEYLAQRFCATLGLSQADPELSVVTFQGRCAPSEVDAVASIKCSFSMNGASCVMYVVLGANLVDRMDGLWRRQIHSAVRNVEPPGMLRIEVAQLGVPPHMLSEYLVHGTVIDLEVPVSDSVILKIGSKPFVAARLISVDGQLGCQTTQGAVPTMSIPEGTSRLCIELAAEPVEAAQVAELGQVGAVYVTQLSLGERVTLTINQEKVAQGRLCIYEGRFAVEVQ